MLFRSGSPADYASDIESEIASQRDGGVMALARLNYPLNNSTNNRPGVDLGNGLAFATQGGRRLPMENFGSMVFVQALPHSGETTLTIQVATAEWGTLTMQKPGFFAGLFAGAARKEWSFSETPSGNLKVNINHLSDSTDMEYRLVAVDVDGKEYSPTKASHSKVASEIFVTYEATFEPMPGSRETWQLPLSRVREVRWQARPYELVEFRNVSLAPGHRTTVEVKDFGGVETNRPKEFQERLANVIHRNGELAFGPVVERLVTAALDFDSGKTGDVPVPGDVAGEDGLNRFFTNVKAFERAGWDFMLDTEMSGHVIYGVGMKSLPLSAADWDDLSVERLGGQINAVLHQQFFDFSPVTNFPVTYAFQTREGGTGILQITGFTENPRGVKLRYKLVQKSSAQTAARADRIELGESGSLVLSNANQPRSRPLEIISSSGYVNAQTGVARFGGAETNRPKQFQDRLVTVIHRNEVSESSKQSAPTFTAQNGKVVMTSPEREISADSITVQSNRLTFTGKVNINFQTPPAATNTDAVIADLKIHLAATASMASFMDKDDVLTAIAKDAARAGDVEDTRAAVSAMTSFMSKDDAIVAAARLLVAAGKKADALELAKLTTSFMTRDDLIRELVK